MRTKEEKRETAERMSNEGLLECFGNAVRNAELEFMGNINHKGAAETAEILRAEILKRMNH